tara:strand:- start:454 stop:654 length:201 start_codon:yes stop_codon:yes gene_type:complete
MEYLVALGGTIKLVAFSSSVAALYTDLDAAAQPGERERAEQARRGAGRAEASACERVRRHILRCVR